MKLSRMDVIIHPVRLRILVAMQGRNLTPKQMAALLPDVPRATLYRHLHTLAEAGLLQVVEQRQAHGAVERVYAMPEGAGDVTPEEFAAIRPEDHERYFTIFISGLMSSFRHYIRREGTDVLKDGFTYGEEAFYLSEEEYRQWREEQKASFRRARANPPGPGRRRLVIAVIAIPDKQMPDA